MQIWICGGPGWATTQVYPARTKRNPIRSLGRDVFVASVRSLRSCGEEPVDQVADDVPVLVSIRSRRLEKRNAGPDLSDFAR